MTHPIGTPVTVGLVGAGFSASFHLRSYRQVQGVPVEICAVASRTRARAEQLAGRYGIPTVHDDHRRLLDDPSISVIDLCVPNALHLPLVLEAARAGKHVVCEKPLTGYFGQGEPDEQVGATPKRAMLDKVRADLAEVTRVMAAHPVKFCYAENWVYAPAVRKALEILDRYVTAGYILEIRGEESHSGSHSEYSKWWRYAGGGSLARLAAHPIGLGLFLKHFEGRNKTGRPIIAVEVLADGVDLTKSQAFASVKGSPIVTRWGDVETWAQTELQAGETTFNTNCAACHGQQAAGTDHGPPLVHKVYEPNHHGDQAFQRAAANGVQAHHWQFGNMPKIESVTPGDVDQIVKYDAGSNVRQAFNRPVFFSSPRSVLR